MQKPSIDSESKPPEKVVDLSQGPADPGRAWTVPAWRRYLVAASCVLAAFLVRFLLGTTLGEEFPYLMFVAASLVAAWYGGAITGIVALLLGLLLGDYFFLPAHGALHSSEWVPLIRYVFTATLGIVLIETLHRSRRRTQLVVEELQREVERRQRSEAELLEAKNQLAEHAEDLERRVAERTTQLAATVDSLKGLLYHIAHNLRAPLRALEGHSTLLASEAGPRLDTAAHRHLHFIAEAAKRMDALIQDLLEYGRLGHLQVMLTNISLKEAVDQALHELAYGIESAHAEVLVVSPLPPVRANAELLQEVLTNVLENALKFVPTGTLPRVCIWAEMREATVRLWIKDNGIGIEPRFHERIFGVFETLQSSALYGGNGIGLAIVKQGMQRMGGQVGVESELGAGSRFWLELPQAHSAANLQAEARVLDRESSSEKSRSFPS